MNEIKILIDLLNDELIKLNIDEEKKEILLNEIIENIRKKGLIL